MGSSERSIKSAPPRRSARPRPHAHHTTRHGTHTTRHDTARTPHAQDTTTHSHDDGFLPFGLRPIDTLF